MERNFCKVGEIFKSVNHLFDGRNCVCVKALAEVYDLVCDLFDRRVEASAVRKLTRADAKLSQNSRRSV